MALPSVLPLDGVTITHMKTILDGNSPKESLIVPLTFVPAPHKRSDGQEQTGLRCHFFDATLVIRSFSFHKIERD